MILEVTYQYNRPHVVLLDPVLPPPAAVLGLGHDGGNLHAVAATGPWGPHGILTGTSDPVLSPPACLPCHGGSLHALTGGYITFNRSLGSLYSFVNYIRMPLLPQVPNLGSLSTHKLCPSSLWPKLWVERQSKMPHINMWEFGDLPSQSVHFLPHDGKDFLANFLFLRAHQILTRNQ